MDGGAIIPPVTGSGCHGGRDTLDAAARAAGKGAAMDRLMQDYPRGPHDQPQSMCPAFGALRVGLRMRRTATILSGSACCVYGLTFTSHFYGARRSVGYVPFNSERWSRASCTRTSGTPFMRRRSPRTTMPWWSSTCACPLRPACRWTGCRR